MQDRHVLVTGGSGGLGCHVSHAFVTAGAHVTVPIFDAAEQPRLCSHLGDALASAHQVEADLRDEASVAALIDGMPKVDAVVHLVGGFAMGPTTEFSLDDVRTQFELNVLTAFAVIKHALRRMRTAGYGRIVTVGSRSAAEPAAQQAAYSAAKAGVVALTRSIAAETRGTNITANAVLPSIIDTPRNRADMGEDQAHTWVQPDALAEVIVFLASEAAGDLRGAALPVYGSA
jgi:NAD(P)-dependent dehydrogenase (short-subunit alcohol dehydrogenase family)